MKENFVPTANSTLAKISCLFLAGALAPGHASACACGCGVFDVATSSMFPGGPGGVTYVQYACQDQNRNWTGTSSASGALNTDKEIETHFVNLGIQYMFNRSWGAELELPYAFRSFRTDIGSPGSPNVVSRSWSQFGDLRVQGIYAGFSEDLSAGLTFGAKLPTGDFRHDPGIVDRDTQLATGSTDLLFGGFYRGKLGSGDWDWFAQFVLEVPVSKQDGYRPGVEVDTAAGIDYRGLSIGRVKIVPIAQLIFSERTSDLGPNAADPVASGYQRLMLSPGVEVHWHPFRFYADVEIPVYQNFTGYQLAAPVLVKAGFMVMF